MPPPRISEPCAIMLPDMAPPSSSVQPSMIIESDMEHPDILRPLPRGVGGVELVLCLPSAQRRPAAALGLAVRQQEALSDGRRPAYLRERNLARSSFGSKPSCLAAATWLTGGRKPPLAVIR